MGPRGHPGQPLPGSACKGSQTAEFPTAALVLITANQWMPDSGQSKPLLPPSRGLPSRWAAAGGGTWDGSADSAHRTSALPNARRPRVPQPLELTAPQLCLVQLHCVGGSWQLNTWSGPTRGCLGSWHLVHSRLGVFGVLAADLLPPGDLWGSGTWCTPTWGYLGSWQLTYSHLGVYGVPAPCGLPPSCVWGPGSPLAPSLGVFGVLAADLLPPRDVWGPGTQCTPTVGMFGVLAALLLPPGDIWGPGTQCTPTLGVFVVLEADLLPLGVVWGPGTRCTHSWGCLGSWQLTCSHPGGV